MQLATYRQIQLKTREMSGFVPKTCWIAHVKELCGLSLRQAPNRINAAQRKNPCPLNKRGPIIRALLDVEMLQRGDALRVSNSRWITAVHEAGHLLTHILSGGQVNYVSIQPTDFCYAGSANAEIFNLETEDGRRKECMTAFGGAAAMQVMNIPDSLRNCYDVSKDFQRCDDILSPYFHDADGFPDTERIEAFQDVAFSEVLTVLGEHRQELMKLANLILSHDDGVQIEREAILSALD